MILDLFNLDNRVALVTGASRGLGQALALGLAEAGADIACVSRTGNDHATRQRVEALGRRFLGLQANLAAAAHRPRLVVRAAPPFGHTHLLATTPATAPRTP